MLNDAQNPGDVLGMPLLALFGNLTIFVQGPEAEAYSFTSSLPAQLLKALAPALQPLMENELLIVDTPPVNGAG